MRANIFLLIAIALILFIPNIASATISSNLDKITYAWDDTLTISGTVGGTSQSEISAKIYNSTELVISLSSTSSGGSTNTFSISSAINDSYPAGAYVVILSSGSDSVNMTFHVVPQKLEMDSYMINSANDVINISTNTIIDDAGDLGGNFSDLIGLSKSGYLHYGNYSIDGKIYHFVLVDQTNASTYDRLYVDDDKKFTLYNDTEDNATSPDVEYQALKEGNSFSNGTFRYVVGETEVSTGNNTILWKPASRTPSSGDNVSFVILAKNSTQLVSGGAVNVTVYNSSGDSVSSFIGTTTQSGWFNATISDMVPGTYTMKLNDTLASITFSVEAFKLFASISDTSNNPNYIFSPNSKARLIITSKNSTGPFNLTSFTATLIYPNGTLLARSKADFSQSSDGIYTYDYDAASAGRYGITISGRDAAGNTQTASAGFEVQSVGFEAMAINTRYIEEADSTGAMVDAFPPNRNVTIMTFLMNITAGGLSAKGPGGDMQGLVTPGNCSSSVSISKITDENGNAYSANYQVMNLSAAMAYLGGMGGEQQPPEAMQNQCMIIFVAPNKTGVSYRAEIKMKYGGEELYSGVKFGVQRLYARGSTVDFKGDDFGFFAPNSTVRIKLRVTDLLTDADVSGENITSVKIIGLQRMFPSFKDILGNASARGTLGENVTNGTISFTSPNDEGFYSMKFRFTASASDGTLETGIGDAFFMLKKYMIWGQLSGAQQGQWYVEQGKNITLEVTVMNIDNAQTVFGGYNSQKSCTGCGGFTINASEIRNDQQFKTLSASDFTAYTGTIVNTTNPTANLTIVPNGNMQTGWYSVDVIVTDPATNSTYFGWAGFEIRNFWVDMQRAYWNESNSKYFFNDMGGSRGGETYGVGSDVEFVVIPRKPNSPDILSPTSITVDSVMSSASWPPVPLSGYTAAVSLKNVDICRVMGEGMPVCDNSMDVYVVKVSGLPAGKQDQYMANVRVNVGGKADVGTFMFSTSSYMLTAAYRRNSFPPLYASTEKLAVNFTGTVLTADGEKGGPHNITNVTVDDLFSQKMGRPIKLRYGENYSASCTGPLCQVNVNLSALSSGEYNIMFAVVDASNNRKIEQVFFKVQDSVISVPSIEEAWIWDTDTASKKVENGIRRGEWSNCQNDKLTINPGYYTFCGEYEINCDQGGCTQVPFNLTVLNVSYSKEIYGYIPMDNNNGQARFGDLSSKNRTCMYSNGSHLWINGSAYSPGLCDLTQTTPIISGAIFSDSNGGSWRFDSTGDQSLTLTGLGALYDTGVLINTSYSRSGVIKLGQIQESNLGAFYSEGGSGGRAGIDLTGDGSTNGTAYFAITDNATSGVYDTFFFSLDGNFSNPISVNDINRTRREFGNGAPKDRLTLLSIDPRAQRVLFYSKQVGDWANLGDIRITNNLSIPIIVAAPDGTERNAIVSVTGYKNTRNWQTVYTVLVDSQNVTGVGELRLNSSSLSGAGDYSFAIETASGDKMEEWKWPMATVRGFLVDGEMGDAFYLMANTGIKQLPVEWKNWENSRVIRIRQDARNDTNIVNGVLVDVQTSDSSGCTVYNSTGGNITDQIAPQFFMADNSPDGNGYFLFNETSGLLYRNATECWFNLSIAAGGTPAYSVGSTLMLNRQGALFNMTLLQIDAYDPPNWRADFGVAGIDPSVIMPMLNNTGNPAWGLEWGYMQNASIFGTYYDVILANSTYIYQRCLFEQSFDGQCVKSAWLVPRPIGNFSSPSAYGRNVSDTNFTKDLYIAGLGPFDGDGITVANFSRLGPAPWPSISMIPLADLAPTYFAALNESALGYDLDKDSAKNKTFYMLAFDSDFNSIAAATSIILDDDLEFLPGTLNVNGNQIQYDFTGNESGALNESWNGLPSGIRSGNARFGSMQDNAMWENQPEWEVPYFNASDKMIFKKSKWNVNTNDSVDVLLKVFNFNQQPIQGANISVTQVAKSSFIGFQKLSEGTDYSVNRTYNITDSNGYGLLKFTPQPAGNAWAAQGGNYQILLNVQTPQGNETFERWFCVGNCGGW